MHTQGPEPTSNRKLLAALISLSWPIVLARATQSVIGFSDAFFVAPLGEAPLAATTTGSLNAFAAMIFPTGAVFIVQSFVAQLRGRGEAEGAARFAAYGLATAAVSGALAALAIPFVPALIGAFRYPPEVAGLMATYLGIRLWSVAAAVGTEALGNFFGGLGNTRPSMIAAVVAMVANVGGCYALIQPRFGLPGYGVQGAAWASVGASWLGFAVIAVPFAHGRRTEGWGSFRLAEFVRFLRFGLPNGMNWFLEFAAFALYINVVVAHLGTTVLAAFNVVMQINSVSFMPAFGLASGGAILVGEAIGKGSARDVWPILRLTTTVACAWMGSIGAAYAVFPTEFMRLFGSDPTSTGELVRIGSWMLAFAAWWQLIDALNMSVSEALRAAGDTVWCMVARILLAWVVFMPFGYASVFVYGGGVGTVMLSLLGYVALLGLTLSLRFASGRWKNIELIEPSLL
jgi:MATE family multidrug resistance protein